MRLPLALLGLVASAFACTSSEGDSGSASAGHGGATAAGGAGTTGAGTTGSVATGGTATGGTATGGTANAGSANGGNAGKPGGGVAGGSAGRGGASAGKGNGGTTTAGTSGRGGTGPAAAGMGGADDAASSCKRGIAANTAPGPAFSPAIGWWYDWSMKGSSGSALEFVPMMWGKSDVSTSVPSGASFLLTFNEPNFHAQSNLTAEAAAMLWPMVEAKANAAGVPIVSPAMNFCGPAADCNGTSPYDYLKDFFAACTDCQVDYVAVHWYNCDLPSLKDYLEPGGSLEGFEQFGHPIWLTEFSCNGDASAADQEAFMRAAIPYLEQNPHVFRYSWFSADPIPNAKLVADDGSPTALGNVYMSLDGACSD